MTMKNPARVTSQMALMAIEQKPTNLSIVDRFGDGVPETYPGGKNGEGVYQRLINQIPPHRVYIEPFLGSGAVLRHKKLAEISYGIERSITTFKRWENQNLPGLTVINADAISWLKKYKWQGDEFD